ncbi:DNA polymerase lambda [Melia azedarach]|uniref:DNA polymerase lambda n=1 Tax=Melia azedarach TaxID=155640 RepID=A0ACC1XIG2_MELAZ|nr:DNA polymerase lambda [Melia azedarach]
MFIVESSLSELLSFGFLLVHKTPASCRRRRGNSMAPKATKNRTPSPDPNGIFAGVRVLLVENGVQNRRLQIWKQKLVQMGATVEENLSKKVTHVLAMDLKALLQQVSRERLTRFKGSVIHYQWLEDSLRLGEKVSEDLYTIKLDSEGDNKADKSSNQMQGNGNASSEVESSPQKRIKSSNEDVEHFKSESRREMDVNALSEAPNSPTSSDSLPHTASTQSLPYSPPDLNKNITEIFGKLINIYRALGEDRRSFSYYKAIPVIEKLPFKIESADQVKGLPGIGKSMQDHIQEIVTTGKLSKLEHFEKDEKVRTISLFGEVWGIGPATALKLYEKGHRTLDDLKNDDSLTHSQRLGLKYFDDIKTRIPRHEVQEMECLLQKAGEEVLPGVVILCGGSFRRGKASCGDLDVVITHPDGKSHKGFLSRYVKHLKEMKFLREDLVFTTHSEQGTDSDVDTYFGLCTYPGRELRHRIDFKVYPRDIYAFGLIAWTGNDVLNRRLRLLAESKGYRLDDTGLFPATHGSDGKQGVKGSVSLKFDTEKEVFDFLGFPWLEPHERNL